MIRTFAFITFLAFLLGACVDGVSGKVFTCFPWDKCQGGVYKQGEKSPQ